MSEIATKKKKDPVCIYVDMDGTLAEFRSVTNVIEFFEKDFFKNLKPQKNIVSAIKKLLKEEKERNIRIYTLSSIIKGHKTARAEKNAWLDKYLPELPKSRRKYVMVGENKADMLKDPKRSILIDDFGPLVDAFFEKGGTAIKVSRNSTDMVYEQSLMKHPYYIEPEMTPHQIRNYVIAVREQCFENAKEKKNDTDTNTQQ